MAATGGSTNAVLHLLAMAREAGVALNIDDFNVVSERTPLLLSLKPAGQYVAADVDKAGGIGVIAKRLVDGGYVDGSAVTMTGKTLTEEAALAVETPGQQVVRPLDNPIKKTGGLVILKGFARARRRRHQGHRHRPQDPPGPGPRVQLRRGRHVGRHPRPDPARRCVGHPL